MGTRTKKLSKTHAIVTESGASFVVSAVDISLLVSKAQFVENNRRMEASAWDGLRCSEEEYKKFLNWLREACQFEINGNGVCRGRLAPSWWDGRISWHANAYDEVK